MRAARQLDLVFWALMLALPMAIGLLGMAVWTLGWHFFAWK